MSFENISKNLKIIKHELNEGLSKNKYNEIIKDVEIGVEIEVVTSDDSLVSGEDTARFSEMTYDWTPDSGLTDFLDKFNDYANTIKDTLISNGIEIDTADDIVHVDLDSFDLQREDNYDNYVKYVNDMLHGIDEILYQNTVALDDLISSLEDVVASKDYSLIRDKKPDYGDEELEQYFRHNVLGLIKYLVSSYNSLYEDDYERVKNDALSELEYYLSDAMSEYIQYGNTLESVEGELSPILSKMYRKSSVDFEYKVTTDSSLGLSGLEVITPAVGYDDFLTYVPLLMDKLSELGFMGDNRCGYHIGLSSTSIDIKELIRENYEYYQDLGFNKLTSLMVATQQGYKSVYRYNDNLRGEDNEFTQSLAEYIGIFKNIEELKDLEDILYSNKFDSAVTSFYSGIKYSNTNLSKGSYVELRTLGGSEGFDVLSDEDRLKDFLYDSISQVFGGVVKLSKARVIRFMTQFLREFNKREKPKVDDKLRYVAHKLNNAFFSKIGEDIPEIKVTEPKLLSMSSGGFKMTVSLYEGIYLINLKGKSFTRLLNNNILLSNIEIKSEKMDLNNIVDQLVKSTNPIAILTQSLYTQTMYKRGNFVKNTENESIMTSLDKSMSIHILKEGETVTVKAYDKDDSLTMAKTYSIADDLQDIYDTFTKAINVERYRLIK